MKRIVYLTEADLFRISKRVLEEQEIEEGIFDGISDIYHGLVGIHRGEGYHFFKHLSTLRNMAKELKRLDLPNKKIMDKLLSLKDKISISKMDPSKKAQLIFEINAAMKHFDEYSSHIDNLEIMASQRLKGTARYSGTPTYGLGGPTTTTTTIPITTTTTTIGGAGRPGPAPTP